MDNPFETIIEYLQRLEYKITQLEQQRKVEIEEFLTVKQAAKVLNMSASGVYRLTMDKKLPFKKFNGRVFFIREELIQFIKNNGK